MEDLNASVSHYLAGLGGPDSDNAFHSLLEAGSAAIPLLMTALSAERTPLVRKYIVELLWRSRDPSVVGSLAAALDDPSPEVWKAALDGLVTLGGASSRAVLRNALASAYRGEHKVPAVWLSEAMEQLEAEP